MSKNRISLFKLGSFVFKLQMVAEIGSVKVRVFFYLFEKNIDVGNSYLTSFSGCDSDQLPTVFEDQKF